MGELSNEDYSIVPGTDHEELQQLKVIVERLEARVSGAEIDIKWMVPNTSASDEMEEANRRINSFLAEQIENLKSDLRTLKCKKGFWSRILG